MEVESCGTFINKYLHKKNEETYDMIVSTDNEPYKNLLEKTVEQRFLDVIEENKNCEKVILLNSNEEVVAESDFKELRG